MNPVPDEALWNALEELQSGHEEQVVGDLWTAAEAAGVMPNTLRVWMSRGKLKPLLGDRGEEVFHIPTVIAVAAAGRAKNVPKDPAANARGSHRSRGPHLHAAA